MRPLVTQFTVRRLMILVAVVAAALAIRRSLFESYRSPTFVAPIAGASRAPGLFALRIAACVLAFRGLQALHRSVWPREVSGPQPPTAPDAPDRP